MLIMTVWCGGGIGFKVVMWWLLPLDQSGKERRPTTAMVCVCAIVLYSKLYYTMAGPQLGRMKRAERVAELQRNYFFHCSCPACGR